MAGGGRTPTQRTAGVRLGDKFLVVPARLCSAWQSLRMRQVEFPRGLSADSHTICYCCNASFAGEV